MSENHNCCGGKHHEGGCGCNHEHHEGGCGCHHNHEHHEHGCGCHHEHEEEFMTLLLDNDTEVKCSVIDIFEVEDKEYIALLPVGEDEVLLYQYIENDNENFELKNIETDEEFEKVEDAFFALFNEDIFDDFDDEEYEYEYEEDDE